MVWVGAQRTVCKGSLSTKSKNGFLNRKFQYQIKEEFPEPEVKEQLKESELRTKSNNSFHNRKLKNRDRDWLDIL